MNDLDSDFIEFDNDIYSISKTQIRKYVLWIVILIIINTILFTFLIKGMNSLAENFKTSISANLIGFNIIGFILGAIFALIPYKKLPYSKKYLRASLLTILTIQAIIFVGLIIIGIMTLVNWY